MINQRVPEAFNVTGPGYAARSLATLSLLTFASRLRLGVLAI
jgi:hypothetical protein